MPIALGWGRQLDLRPIRPAGAAHLEDEAGEFTDSALAANIAKYATKGTGLIVATGRVPGLLKRWTRSTDGRWFGRVNFKITDKYGAEMAEHVFVLVPAHALRPR